MTTLLLRPLTEADLIDRTSYDRQEGGDDLGERFFDAAVAALGAIRRMPNARSPCIGELSDIPGLRVRRIVGFPCGWFDFTAADHVDIVRLLADAQDLPSILADIDPRCH